MEATRVIGRYEKDGLFFVDTSVLSSLKLVNGQRVELIISKYEEAESVMDRKRNRIRLQRESNKRKLRELCSLMKREKPFAKRVHQAKISAFQLYQNNADLLEGL
ncbi:hypothetical protein KKH56_00415 [bacterium]|nr:hypothetical protein [bacterium]